jgi:hypothetical protein
VHPNFFLVPASEDLELDVEAEEMEDERELGGDMMNSSFSIQIGRERGCEVKPLKTMRMGEEESK